jgi:L-threonylcarbamoyladenylate synthase
VQTRVLPAGAEAVDEAARVLATGGLVAFPTETVYGIGADATDGRAVARIYAAKGRPSFNPLIAHVAEIAAARRLGAFNDDATRLAATFWPGPLTLVLPKAAFCPIASLATAGLDSVAVRLPDHPVARAVIAAFGRPVVAPSANRSGHVSPTTAAHVLADLGGRIDLIIDGGPTRVGVESTIVACLGGASGDATLLRPGGLPRAEIERVLGHRLGEAATPRVAEGEAPLAPGMLASHYAPKSLVRLNAVTVNRGEALLGFGPVPEELAASAAAVLNLSECGDLIEAAANLFSHLRTLDEAGPRTIAVMPVPAQGLGEAINDRLARAAAQR